ncbi:hypothetical protein ACFXHA_12895 [Nocardia sp. NPDC059240]|uniref:hypothetical protein n=1 Tax=Nocardia sp. NPDC059240 TaxID=3346786 RepID=UPI0036C1C0AA
MGMAMYFSATRERPLEVGEIAEIDRGLEAIAEKGKEPYSIDDDGAREPGTIFSRWLQLPKTAAAWDAIHRWSVLLTHIRRHVPDAEWLVTVDDHEIVWDEQLRAFDPSR